MKLLLLALMLGGAPFQCASDPDPNRRLEDTPAEALWNLAERFRAQSDEDARAVALHELIDRYPTSSEAERARMVLEGRDVPPDPRECITEPVDDEERD